MITLQKLPGYTYFDSFTFNGAEYKIGSVVKIKRDIYVYQHKYGFLYKYPKIQLIQSYLDANKKYHRWVYAIWSSDDHVTAYTTIMSPDEMIESVIENYQEDTKPQYYKDSEVEGVIFGWFVYIFVMIFGIIFTDFIVLWVAATVFFFSWRKSKLKKRPQIRYENESEEVKW